MKKLILFSVLLLSTSIMYGQIPKTRTLEQLINKNEPYWEVIQSNLKNAKNKVEVLPKDTQRADSVLYDIQVTTRSPMGAVVYETGGIFINNGWIRILGSGSNKLPRTLISWNQGKSILNGRSDLPYLLIADDVMGGFYAINNGGISIDSESIRKVFYFSPDNLQWEPMDWQYSEFLQFCFYGDINKFYESMLWTGWEKEVMAINGDKGIQCLPPLWTMEGKDVSKVSRKTVPIEEIWGINIQIATQIDGKSPFEK